MANNTEHGSSVPYLDDQAIDLAAIRKLTETCHALFENCQQHPFFPDNDCIDKMSADFNWWSLGIGAAKSGRSSLDYRVHARDDVRDLFIDLLNSLAVSLNHCLTTVDLDKTQHKLSQMNEKQETESENEASSEEEDTGLDEQIYYITTTLRYLSKISKVIRKSSTDFRHQQADNSFQETDGTLGEFKTFLTHLVLIESFVKLMSEVANRETWTRELVWSKTWEVLMNDSTKEERLSPVQKRLIRANLVRRNRFNIYNQNKKADMNPKAAAQAKIGHSEVRLNNEPTSSQPHDRDSKTKIKEHNESAKIKIADDTSRQSSQPATHLGDFVIPQPPKTQRTKSVSTKFSQGVIKQDYPKCPTAEGKSFWCPYCAQALDASYSGQKKRNKWRGHVAEDLCPYVCVYLDCQKPNDMYTTTDDWKNHLKASHGVSHWICDVCWFEDPNISGFSLEEEWRDHMMAKHGEDYDETDLPDLAEAQRRTVIPPVSCPLCHGSTPLLQPETDKHISEHLHSFALQALPWETIESEDYSRASNGPSIENELLDHSYGPDYKSKNHLDEASSQDRLWSLSDIENFLERCTKLATKQEAANSPKTLSTLTDLKQTLQILSERFKKYSSDERQDIATCLRHLELIFRRYNTDGLMTTQTLESLEADIVTRLISLKALAESGRENFPMNAGITQKAFHGFTDQNTGPNRLENWLDTLGRYAPMPSNLGSASQDGYSGSDSNPKPEIQQQPISKLLEEELSEPLKKILRKVLVTCAQHSENKRFIPRGQLEKTCNIRAVRRELKRVYPESDPNFCEQLASLICRDQTQNSSAISQSYFNIFAILALINEARLIDFFLEHSLCDDDLPFHCTSDFQKMWSNNKQEKDHIQFPDGVDDEFIEMFTREQWSVLVPFFESPKSSSLRCNFYVFDDKTILPITHVSKNKHIGGFGVIERVQLHEDHHEFKYSHFALKTFHSMMPFDQKTKLFQQELRAFQQAKPGSHLIDVCAAFKKGENYSFLFPWADGGTINHLWSKDPQDLVADKQVQWPEFGQWVCRQCYGIIRDLRSIHEPRDRSQTKNEANDDELYGIHSDIKPDNILHFTDDGTPLGVLKVSDLGLMKFHRLMSRTVQSKSMGVAYQTYRAPEHDIGMMRSRKVDIWAFGCLFAEFLSWAIAGRGGIEHFRNMRVDEDKKFPDPNKGEWYEDHFFTMRTGQPKRKDSVAEWFTDLSSEFDENTFFPQFLSFIQNSMLNPYRIARVDAKDIEKFLKTCLGNNVNSSYWLFDGRRTGKYILSRRSTESSSWSQD